MSPKQIEPLENSIVKTINFLSTNNILPINIFILKHDGAIIWANARLLKEVNETLDSIQYKNVCIFGETAANGLKRVVVQKKEEIVEEEYKGNHFITCRYPIIESGECVKYIVGISLNITKTKHAERAKQEFLQNMAHDIRTPLAGIIGVSELLEKNLIENTEVPGFGKMLREAGNQLLELLNKVIETIDTEHMTDPVENEPLDLIGLARELQALMQPSIYTKKLAFYLNVDQNLPLVLTDRLKLKRVLINILSNAIKFTKEGNINFNLQCLKIENNHAQIEISVKDTGIGIEKDKLNQIFDRFYRVHPTFIPEYSGYGLGLYAVQKTLDLLQGHIKVSSEPGKGSQFTMLFNFPLADDFLAASSTSLLIDSEQQDVVDNRAMKGTVFIGEDNAIVCSIVQRTLINAGYRVVAKMDGESALIALKTQSFDWALLDIGLPNLKGTKVCQYYRRWEKQNHKPHLPIFALTGHSVQEVKQECIDSGIDNVYTKPLTEELLQKIEKLIAAKEFC